jgi:hypothetical protein
MVLIFRKLITPIRKSDFELSGFYIDICCKYTSSLGKL